MLYRVQSPAADWIVSARRQAGLTQQELARRTGLALCTVARYEIGRRDPAVGVLCRLVEACGMQLHIADSQPQLAAHQPQRPGPGRVSAVARHTISAAS